MNREIKTPIDKLQERFANQRKKGRLEFSRTEKIGEYRIKSTEIKVFVGIECPIESNYVVSGLDSLKNVIERLRQYSRQQNKELVIIDKDTNTEHKSFSEINNIIEDCHDRQRINATNKRIRDSYSKRMIRPRKVKKIDMRIYENR